MQEMVKNNIDRHGFIFPLTRKGASLKFIWNKHISEQTIKNKLKMPVISLEKYEIKLHLMY